LALEGNEYVAGKGKFKHANIKKHVTGFDIEGAGATEVLINSSPNSKKATYKIDDDETDGISIVITSSTSKADLSKLTRMENICDKNTTTEITDLSNGTNVTTFTCKMKR
jgi:vacuolar-type H+-ATPase subunit F/Vma7